MKSALSLFALLSVLVAALRAGEPDPVSFFGFKGRVTVKEGKKLLDGGTTIVDLQDEAGTSLHIVWGAAWTYDESKNQHITISFPQRIHGNYLLSNGGKEEETLLALLHQAALNSFGTADAKTSGKMHWQANAVRNLIRVLSEHTHQADPGDK